MKYVISASAIALLASVIAAPVSASGKDNEAGWAKSGYIDTVDKRGRDKPRVPGGSGCDDPEDIIEHPECR